MGDLRSSSSTHAQIARHRPPSMSTTSSSQYYGSSAHGHAQAYAHVHAHAHPHPHPHYQDFPAANHDQLQCALAVTWQQDPNHDSYTGPLPAPYLAYQHAGAGSAAASLPPAAPSAWTSACVRPELPEWHHDPVAAPVTAAATSAAGGGVPEDGIVARPGAPFATRAGHGSGPVDQQQQHNQEQQAVHAQPQSATGVANLFSPIEPFHTSRPSQLSLHSPAHTIETTFSNHGTASSSRTASVHAINAQVLLPSPTAWDPHQPTSQYPGHIDDAFQPGVTSVGQNNPIEAWSIANSDDPAMNSVIYDHSHHRHQEWDMAPAQSHRDRLPEHRTSVDSFHVPTSQNQPSQRSVPKKKISKVPSSFVERQEKLKVSKRKGPLHEKQREKTHTMRKTKRICVRCRFYKSGCDEGDPCEKCEKITGHARSFREPCYREHLEDTSLVRRCNGREHQEEAEFLGYDWIHHSHLCEMEIIWNLPGYGPIPNAQPMRITYRPYSPRRGELDMAASVWSNTNGEVTAVQQPPYAIYDTANLVPAFERYFSSQQQNIETWIFARIQQDETASLTFSEVVRMRSIHNSKALDLAMRLQCLSVVSQGYGSVWSSDIPGIQEYDYRRLGRSDYEAYDRKQRDRPLPGAITHQMDVAAVKYLRKLEKLFVKELTALIFRPRIKPWYELFLAFYVIFWNLEYIHHGAQDYIKSKNGTLIENQVSNVVTNQIKKWEFAFPVLLYHWRCILRGYSPFKLARDNPEELREKGHIDEAGFQYVTKIARLFDREDSDRFQPPLTGFAAAHWSTASDWIVKLFKEAGA